MPLPIREPSKGRNRAQYAAAIARCEREFVTWAVFNPYWAERAFIRARWYSPQSGYHVQLCYGSDQGVTPVIGFASRESV